MVTLSPHDLDQLKQKGISQAQIERQLDEFKTGFPFLKLESAASIGKGIVSPSEDDIRKYVESWNEYKKGGKKIMKFVPASGAASRMFKDLFAFLDATNDEPTTDFVKDFFANISKFAFFKELDTICKKNEGLGVAALMASGKYKLVVENLLTAMGLNYGQLPKGLLLFHSYSDGARTPLEEHLVEGALYADSEGVVHIHYTVSPEHQALLKPKFQKQRVSMKAFIM